MNFIKKLFFTLRAVGNHPLNRGARFKSMRDFCLAQVAVRLIPGDVCVPFPNQTRLLISPRMKGAAHFISPGLCEYEEMMFALHFLRSGDLFVDVGANVGAYMLLASGAAGAGVIAVEPSPATFSYLAHNVKLNDVASKVTAVNAALGRSEGRLRLTERLGTENYVSLDGDAGPTVEVKVTTLDLLLREAKPTLIKIDVEGFETEVLAGAEQTLSQPALQAMIIERTGIASRYGFDERDLHRRIRQRSFAPFAYRPAERRLVRVSDDAEGNIIYVRDLDSAQRRLREAPSFAFRNGTI